MSLARNAIQATTIIATIFIGLTFKAKTAQAQRPTAPSVMYEVYEVNIHAKGKVLWSEKTTNFAQMLKIKDEREKKRIKNPKGDQFAVYWRQMPIPARLLPTPPQPTFRPTPTPQTRIPTFNSPNRSTPQTQYNSPANYAPPQNKYQGPSNKLTYDENARR